MNGNVNTYLIKGLSPDSEYEVLLAAIYGNEIESDEVVLVETTGNFSYLKNSIFSVCADNFVLVSSFLSLNFWVIYQLLFPI